MTAQIRTGEYPSAARRKTPVGRILALPGHVLMAVRFVVVMSRATIRICLRYRVTGLAAEAGFFALLSMPPLVLGLVGCVGYVSQWLGGDVVADLRLRLSDLAETFLTAESVTTIIEPTFDDVLANGRADIISIGFLLSIWSGSRVLNVFVDTIAIMYGLGGKRGIVRTRVLSLSLYAAGLLVGIIVIPLVLVGPGVVDRLLTSGGHDTAWLQALSALYWPVVILLALSMLTTLYHVATPVRSPWRNDVPGALLALVIWLLASYLLRWIITHSVGGTSIYGPLATPIIVLIWLYFLAIAVLIGAGLNAAFDERFPQAERVAVRRELRLDRERTDRHHRHAEGRERYLEREDGA